MPCTQALALADAALLDEEREAPASAARQGGTAAAPLASQASAQRLL